MDKLLIFNYFGKIVRSEGKTEVECFYVEMIRPLENEEVLVGKPARTLIIRVFMIVGASWQEKTFQLPRNSPVTRFCQIRTTNRHRWTGRVYQGERDNYP